MRAPRLAIECLGLPREGNFTTAETMQNLKIWLLILGFGVCVWRSPVHAARPFTLQTTNLVTGEKFDFNAQLPGLKDQTLVLVFLSAVCPCSDSHRVELTKLKTDFPQFAFFGVHSNSDEDSKATLEYFQKSGLPFPVLQDQKTKLADQFQALKTPHAFVISPAGDILFRGGVSNSSQFATADRKYLREALEDTTQRRPVRTAQARPLGCAISR